MSYIHGAKLTRVASLTAGRNELPSQVIGLVGVGSTANKANTPTLITNITQARATYGADVGGTNLMSALETIYAHISNAKVVVVNVLDSSKLSSVIDSNTGKTKKVSGKWVTGIHQASIPTTTGYVNLSTQIISGIEKVKRAESTVGERVKVLIAPGYSQIISVRDALLSTATEMGAMAVSDIPATSVAAAITARNSNYAKADKRLLYCFPNMIRTNTNESEDQEASYSQYVASALAGRIGEDSYGYTPSSFELTGISQPKVAISCSMSNDAAESNLLNAKGIVTYFKQQLIGYRVWGNWTSNYPTSSKPEDMIGVARTWDSFDELIQDTVVAFADQKVTNGLIDYIVAVCNNKISYLLGKGLLVAGKSELDSELTTAEAVAQGKLYFKHTLTFATNLDTVEFISVSDINGYENLI